MGVGPQEASQKENAASDVTELCSLGELIESKVGHEINLIDHRMTWLVVSESFLFGAFAAVVASLNPKIPLHAVLLWLLPVVGICVVVLVYPSLIAAHFVMADLIKARGVIECKLKDAGFEYLPKVGGRATRDRRWTYLAGAVPMWFVPIVILAAWVIVVLSVSHRITWGLV
jgi:hypothetical protein